MKRIFNSALILCFPLVLFMFSCERKFDNTCMVDDPIKELPWIKERMNTIVTSSPETAKFKYVTIAEYEGQTVFLFGDCDPLALTVFPIYNCNGDFIANFGDFPLEKLSLGEVIWKTEDSECTF